MSATRLQFDEELDTLCRHLLEMGSDADSMVERAIRALTEQNVRLAEEVIANDDVVDDLDLRIETQCLRMIALQQPVARDLRLIATTLKIITDLERIGDNAVDIAKAARELARYTFFKPLVDIPRMAACVRQMIRDALVSFVNHDLDLVHKVVEADDEVDVLFYNLRDELHGFMQRDPALVMQASYLLFVAHYLERIADHAVNIAERVYYVETGNLVQLAKSHRAIS